ncbi:MAG TPA: DUF2064 domain-containing protein, partial [Acidimicrobiales bacterium]|nr:DUF2064 domain-containing protein [Acidimicrobiales bacterium]
MTPKHVIVMAKAPVPGRVKTRLCPPCTPVSAAAVAEACLADTLDAVACCRAEYKVLALDGPVGPWLPAGFQVIEQRGDGLAARLANAWKDTAALTGGNGLQIGMDTPQTTSAELDILLDLVGQSRSVLGPAVDGGWWVIGLCGTDPDLVFRGVAMSDRDTGRAQAERLRSLGLDVVTAPAHRDIDTV